jgi:electron transfer flavoprotein beta subunit
MSIHSIVCIKSVVRAAPDGSRPRTPDNSELNPFDRPALEAALRLKAVEGGTLTALSMGPAVGAKPWPRPWPWGPTVPY